MRIKSLKEKQDMELAMQNFNQNSLEAFINDDFSLFIKLYDYNGNDWIIEVSEDEIQYRAEKQYLNDKQNTIKQLN